MPIDIIKIGQIKKLKQLRKYDLDKPIYNSNYCFHYLILTSVPCNFFRKRQH